MGGGRKEKVGARMIKRIKTLFHRPKKEEQELEWWEKPDAPPDKKPTEGELIKQIERMRIAQRGTPKGLIVKQLIALIFIVVNGGLLYSAIGKPLSTWVYIYTLPSILILFDYLFTVRTLRKLAEGV